MRSVSNGKRILHFRRLVRLERHLGSPMLTCSRLRKLRVLATVTVAGACQLPTAAQSKGKGQRTRCPAGTHLRGVCHPGRNADQPVCEDAWSWETQVGAVKCCSGKHIKLTCALALKQKWLT